MFIFFLCMEKELSKETLLDSVNGIVTRYKFDDPNYVPTKSDWPFIIAYPDPRFFKQLFFIYFLNKTKGGNSPVFTNKYLEDSDNYAKPKEFYEFLKGYAKSLDAKLLEGMSYKYLTENIKGITKFIMEMDLFSPKRLFKLFEKNELYSLEQIKPYLKLLSCFRPSYSREDLEYMRKLKAIIDNLTDFRELVLKKNLLGNEKMIACCPCGNKFDPEIEYCEKCGRNQKGFNKEEVKILTSLKAQIEALDIFFKAFDIMDEKENKNHENGIC